jgi:hypothetical protein
VPSKVILPVIMPGPSAVSVAAGAVGVAESAAWFPPSHAAMVASTTPHAMNEETRAPLDIGK